PDRGVAHEREERREEQTPYPDAHLDESVERQQRRRPPDAPTPFDEPPGQRSEQPVSQREPAEEETEDRGGRFAVRAEQDREVLLPGDLVGETREAREQGEEEDERSNHRRSITQPDRWRRSECRAARATRCPRASAGCRSGACRWCCR